MINKILVAVCLSIINIGHLMAADIDPNLWLEEVDGQKALAWVEKTNLKTVKSLGTGELYNSLYDDALSALNSKDKLPNITQKGNWVYNYHKAEEHPRGIYRRSTLDSFNSAKPAWQTVLDIDKMSKQDNIKWVFHGMTCLKPLNEKCYIELSPGGGDANELREFDAKTLEFVDGGFQLPTSKMRVSWMDQNHLFVASDFGEGTMTDSGYPRIIKIWQRGTPIEKAKNIFETDTTSVLTYASRYRSERGDIDLIIEGLTFWKNRYFQLLDDKPLPLALPESASVIDAINGQLVVKLNDDWTFNDSDYKQGSVVLVAPKVLRGEAGEITLLIEATSNSVVEEVTVTSKSILVVVLEDVKSKVYQYKRLKSGWHASDVALPKSGKISIEASNDRSGEFFARYEGFLTPPTLYMVDAALKVKVALKQSSTFDASQFKVEQYFVDSNDGTKVPYFVVMNKNTKLNGMNPTSMFSYGGFRVSLTPSYSGSYEDLNGAYGKMWLERGGVFVLANIRGGGEYGPAWHSAALLSNRHKAYEDFEAIAQDLFKRKITSAKHLGIEGRSNGGLLVGAAMVRRPDLFGAVICGVPLLDMQRYHKLLAGASWVAEYGDPDTADWDFIKAYSPYQNVDEDIDYPPTFFFTSTRDDRVHPGHARKMVAKMAAQGHKVDYYENTEGGHKGSSTSEQLAKRIAMGYTHLWQNLK